MPCDPSAKEVIQVAIPTTATVRQVDGCGGVEELGALLQDVPGRNHLAFEEGLEGSQGDRDARAWPQPCARELQHRRCMHCLSGMRVHELGEGSDCAKACDGVKRRSRRIGEHAMTTIGEGLGQACTPRRGSVAAHPGRRSSQGAPEETETRGADTLPTGTV
jgi:hypothetical protein